MLEKYNYFYQGIEVYCYRDTNTLINKLDIRDEKERYEVERELVSFRALELEFNPIKGDFDLEHL